MYNFRQPERLHIRPNNISRVWLGTLDHDVQLWRLKVTNVKRSNTTDYGVVCRSNPGDNISFAHVSRNNDHPILATIVAVSPYCLSKALFEAKINGISV